MEAQKLNLLFTQYAQDESVFFQTPKLAISYTEFVKQVFSLAHQLKKSSNDFFAVKIQDPYLVFCYALAAPLAQKKILLLSPLEKADLTEKHSENIPFQEIIYDQHSFHSKIEITEEYFFTKITFDEPYLFLLSSGSSGQPKGISHSLLTLLESASAIVQELGMKKEEVTYLNLPVNHIGGLMIFWRSFLSGGIVSTKNDHYDYASFVPLQLDRMLKDEKSLTILKNSKALLIGGSKLSDDLKAKSHSFGINVFETYGMTETASAVLLNGKPIENQNIKIENENFLIKGPTLAVGFYQERIFHPLPLDSNGFYVTNDRGRAISENCFQFVERLDLNFKSGGELINPLLIEQCLKELPWIKEAITTSVPHPEWTEATCLLYETTAESHKTIEEEKELIKAHIKSRLHPFMVPKYFFPYLFSDSGLKPARYFLKTQARLLQSLELIDHTYIESPKDTKRFIVFLHGFLGDKTDMEEWAKNLSHENTSFLFLSLPGHGKTKIKDFIDREDIFQKISGLISFYQQGYPLFLYGYSMGGRIALELALNYLQVDKLILESASFGLESNEEKSKRFDADQNLFKNFKSTESFLRNWYQASLFGDYNKSSRFEEDLKKKLTHETSEWEKSLDYFSPGKGKLLSECLGQIQNKKLNIELIVGEKDEKYLKHYQEISSKLNINLQVVKNSAHNPHKTNPQSIVQILNTISGSL